MAWSKTDADDAVLLELAKILELTKPVAAEHFLYFPTEESARKASRELQADGFRCEVQPAATGSEWLALAVSDVVLDKRSVAELHETMERVASSHDGEYDGWGAPAEQRGT